MAHDIALVESEDEHAAYASFDDRLEDEPHTYGGVDQVKPQRQETNWVTNKTLGLAIAGGAGLTLFALRNKIKQLLDWEESIEETSQNSSDMLIGKLNLAKDLSAVRDIEGVRNSLSFAKKEARKLSKVNREFEKRLAAFSSLPDKLS